MQTAALGFGSEAQRPPVNHEVMGSRLDYQDFFFTFQISLDGILPKIYLHSFSNYSFNTNNF